MENIKWEEYGRIAVYIDNANIIHSPPRLGWYIGLEKLNNFFKNSGNLQLIKLFDAIPEEEELNRLLRKRRRSFTKKDYKKYLESSNKQRGFFKRAEEEWEIDVVLKPLRFILDKKIEKYIPKGDCDVDLTVDAIKRRKRYDSIFLISGDGDYVAIVEYLKLCRKRVIVMSTRNLVANILIDAADEYISFDRLKDELFLKPYLEL